MAPIHGLYGVIDQIYHGFKKNYRLVLPSIRPAS